MNLTKTYQLNRMQVGDSFKVYEEFQHARVAASDYARKNNVCFSCRMSERGIKPRYMTVHRVENNQQPIDTRGRRGRRRIVTRVLEPTALQFSQWLATFVVGQSYNMPASYAHLYSAMVAWCELHSIKTGTLINTRLIDSVLVIERLG